MDFPAMDHVGLVVTDLDAAIEQYEQQFGYTVQWREPLTSVPPVALGLGSARDADVQLRGAMLRPRQGGVGIELHEYPNGGGPGIGWSHVAFLSGAFATDYSRLTSQGIEWCAKPRTIESGPLAGRQWIYGYSAGGTVELCTAVPARVTTPEVTA